MTKKLDKQTLSDLADSAFTYSQSDTEHYQQEAERIARELCQSEFQFHIWEELTLLIERDRITTLRDAIDWLRHQLDSGT